MIITKILIIIIIILLLLLLLLLIIITIITTTALTRPTNRRPRATGPVIAVTRSCTWAGILAHHATSTQGGVGGTQTRRRGRRGGATPLKWWGATQQLIHWCCHDTSHHVGDSWRWRWDIGLQPRGGSCQGGADWARHARGALSINGGCLVANDTIVIFHFARGTRINVGSSVGRTGCVVLVSVEPEDRQPRQVHVACVPLWALHYYRL